MSIEISQAGGGGGTSSNVAVTNVVGVTFPSSATGGYPVVGITGTIPTFEQSTGVGVTFPFQFVGVTGTVGVTFPASASGGINPVGITGLVGITGPISATMLNFPLSFGASISNFPSVFGITGIVGVTFPGSAGGGINPVGITGLVGVTGPISATMLNFPTSFGVSVGNLSFGASVSNFPAYYGVTFTGVSILNFPTVFGVTFTQNSSSGVNPVGITGLVGITGAIGVTFAQLGTTTNNSNVFIYGTNFPSSVSNNSTAQLGAAASFTGGIETVQNLQAAQIEVTCDQPYTVVVNQYIDAAGTFISSQDTFTRLAGQPFNENVTLPGNYFNLKVTNNGASTTTTLNINTTFGIMATGPRTVTNQSNNRMALNEINGVSFMIGQQSASFSIPVVMPVGTGFGVSISNTYFGVTFTGVSILNFPTTYGVTGQLGVSISNLSFGVSVGNLSFGASISNTGLGVTFPPLGVTFQAVGLGVTFQAVGLGVTFAQLGTQGITGAVGLTGLQLVSLGATLGKTNIFKFFQTTTGSSALAYLATFIPAAGTNFYLQGYYIDAGYASATAAVGWLGTAALNSGVATLSIARLVNPSNGIDRVQVNFVDPPWFGNSIIISLSVTPSQTNLITWTGNFWGYQK